MAPSYILVTGATGFIGAHVVDALLRRGLRVRGTTRLVATGERMIRDRPQYASQLDFVTIGDLMDPGVFDAALQGGIDGIVHCASPVSLVGDNEKDIIIPAITGTKSILASAAAVPLIQRVVLSSSFAAIVDRSKNDPDFVFTTEHWNPMTYEDGVNGNRIQAYHASKKFGELAAWAFMEESKPGFDLVCISMPLVFGPPAHPLESMSKINVSNTIIWEVARGDYPRHPFQLDYQFVDVRDLAQAYTEALLRPEAGGKRFLLAGEMWLKEQVAEIIRKEFDWAKERVQPGDVKEIVFPYRIDGETSARELGITYTPFEKTIVDAVKRWKEIEDAEHS